MTDLFNKANRDKHLFKTYYCASCKQRKPCHTISQECCCSCAYQAEREKAKEYPNYQQIYQRKAKESKEYIQQLQLLKSYLGCQQCGSLVVDAYGLYDKDQLVCQLCLMNKESGASSPISFAEQSQWYKRHWKVDLAEWLEKYNCLPVNADCARKWQGDNRHLNNCQCLEVEAQENYLLFANSLKEMEERLRKCACETSEKVRVSSDYYAWCEKCGAAIIAASKKRVIKNRNDPKFWGLEIKENVLCGDCLASLVEKMPANKKYTFNKYQKRGYW